jgi:hypothetical protein
VVGWRGRGRALPRTPFWLASGLALAGVVLALAGYHVQHAVNAPGFGAEDATYAWIQEHPVPLRIGLASSFDFASDEPLPPAWPMFGPKLENAVDFVGSLHGDRLEQYSSRSRWLQAVARGRYNLLEIALNPVSPPDRNTEIAWAAQARFPVVTRSRWFELVRVPN